jgi:hypothetical protein
VEKIQNIPSWWENNICFCICTYNLT